MWEVFAALIAIAGLLLREYLAARAKKETTAHDNDTAQFDQALAGRDADALSTAFEQLRVPAAGDGDSGGPDDPAAAERKL